MKKAIKLIYIGDRLNGENLRAAFVKEGDEKTEENIFYFKRGKFFIGEKLQGEQEGENLGLFRKSFEGEEIIDDDLLQKWRMESQAAIIHYRKRASKLRVDKNPLTGYLIDDLKRHTRNLTHRDKVAYLDYLVDEVIFKPQAEEMSRRMNETIANIQKKRQKKTTKKGKKK